MNEEAMPVFRRLRKWLGLEPYSVGSYTAYTSPRPKRTPEEIAEERVNDYLSGEDEEADISDFLDEDDNLMPKYATVFRKAGVKITITESANESSSCGDDGICRTGPGASFYYD